MKPSTICLPESDIPLLLAGDLPPGEIAAAESHLEECDVCRATIESMIADSHWWDEAKSSLAKKPSRDAGHSDAIEADEPIFKRTVAWSCLARPMTPRCWDASVPMK